jgi:hypothetical protein
VKTALAGLVVLSAAGVVTLAQSYTRQAFAKLKVEDDTYPLPPAEQVKVATLGYNAAVADFIYAHVLVSYGLHFEEKRRFEYVARYLDTIVSLDPTFVQTYLYADTLITVQPKLPSDQDYDEARALLLRGTRELPTDQRVWLAAGQFIGYLAPPRFSDVAKRKAWQLEGAQLLSQACELASNDRSIPYHCLAAATTLNKTGQREALITMLARTLAVNDDPELRRDALATMQAWVGEQEREKVQARIAAFDQVKAERFPFLNVDAVLTWASPWAPACALQGMGNGSGAECATNWADWASAYRDKVPFAGPSSNQ